MKKTLITTALSVVLLAAAACGNAGRPVVTDEQLPDSATVQPQDANEPASNEAEANFGQTATLPGTDIKITASKLSKPKLSTYSAPQVKGKAKAFAVEFTIRNQGGEAFDPNELFFEALCGSEEPELIFDSENGFNGQPSKKLTRNKTLRFKMAWRCAAGVLNPIEVDVEHLLSVNDGEITFKGALK